MVRPLTKRRKKDQTQYARPPEIEAEIAEALTQDPLTWRQRLLIAGPRSKGYFQTETLVYLIRDAFRSGDEGLRDSILAVLLTRCDAILHSKVSRSLPYADKIREEIQSDFTLLLARDAAGPTVDALDFYECRFNKAFRTLRLGRVDRTLLEVNRAVELPEEADQVEIDTDAISGRGFFSPVAASFHEAATPEKAAYREQVREALMRLPPNEAEAFILVRLLGYEEESDDPRKETAATRLNCTGRTIRNRLEKAEKKLFTILSKEHP